MVCLNIFYMCTRNPQQVLDLLEHLHLAEFPLELPEIFTEGGNLESQQNLSKGIPRHGLRNEMPHN